MDYPKSVPNVGLVGGKFVDENVATGVVGSLIPSAWGNSVTDELLAVIKAAGFEPAEGNSAQLLAAIKALRGGQLFTSSGLFVVPAGIYRIWVSACAGGSAGAGGGGATNTTGTGGGGAGGSAGQSILWRAFDVVPGQVISITIGVGGIGGTGGGPTTGGGPGSAGGATVIGTLVTLLGAPPSAGGANWSGSGVPSGGSPQPGGFPSGGYGNDGAAAFNGGVGSGGAGASTPFGGGGGAGRSGTAGAGGFPASGFGSGGGGGGGGYGTGGQGANGGPGGPGAPGVAFLEW